MPSAASSAKQPEPFTFFLDRGLGRHKISGALKAAGEAVEIHDDHFSDPTTPDEEWLRFVADRGWVAITKDAATRSNELMVLAATNVGIAAFILGNSNATGERMATALVQALPSVKAALRRFCLPLIARVTLNSHVYVLQSGDEVFRPPKAYKPPRARRER